MDQTVPGASFHPRASVVEGRRRLREKRIPAGRGYDYAVPYDADAQRLVRPRPQAVHVRDASDQNRTRPRRAAQGGDLRGALLFPRHRLGAASLLAQGFDQRRAGHVQRAGRDRDLCACIRGRGRARQARSLRFAQRAKTLSDAAERGHDHARKDYMDCASRGEGCRAGRARHRLSWWRNHRMEGGERMSGFPSKEEMAELTAKMLLEVDAVRFMEDKPFIYTSGWASPVYTDCRRLISFPRVRRALIDFGAATIEREAGFEQFDSVAGGETAGIPFAAWMADRLMLPMQYVRKKPKGFGRNAQIEGHIEEGDRVLLVEDMTSDGRSKVNFCKALRTAGATVDHVFVFFFYDIFPESKKIFGDLAVTLHSLATWWNVLEVAKKSGKFDAGKLKDVEAFMKDPASWSKAHGGVAQAAE